MIYANFFRPPQFENGKESNSNDSNDIEFSNPNRIIAEDESSSEHSDESEESSSSNGEENDASLDAEDFIS